MPKTFLFSTTLANDLLLAEQQIINKRLAVSQEIVKTFGWMVSMNWASKAIEELQQGKQVVIYPRGNSMQPKIESGAAVTLEPITDPNSLKKGDVVLVAVGQSIYLHLIGALDKDRVQIMNNKGCVNGWVMKKNVFGRAIAINNQLKKQG